MAISRTLQKTKEGYTVHTINDPNDGGRDFYWYGYKSDVMDPGSRFRKDLAAMLIEQTRVSGSPLPDVIQAFARGASIDLPVESKPLSLGEYLERCREIDNILPLVAKALLSDLPSSS